MYPTDIALDNRDGSGEIQGSNPFHGSTTGRNYSVNLKKGVWHCFRHNSGGGPLELMGVRDGILAVRTVIEAGDLSCLISLERP